MTTVTNQLKDLAELLREGLITREEFDQQKAALLAEASGRSAPSSPGVPNEVGAYRITGHIGDGGMGSVLRGRHRSEEIAERQGGDVAIKVMHPHIARDRSFAERFETEAGLGLKLDHPGICRVHDLVVDGGVLALVMELVEGRPLSDIIGTQTGPIPWERAWPMFSQLLDAVAYMHGRGVLHRDIKPENVLVTPAQELKLLDLGIAKDIGSGKTRTGVGMGTVDYMAPEQHTDASKVDARADIYALGMTLYEMLAGELPWGGDLGPVAVLQRKLSEDVPPPTIFYPDIPAAVVSALMVSLDKDRDARPASVEQFRGALQAPSPPSRGARAPIPPSRGARPGPAAAPVPSPPARPQSPQSPPAARSRGSAGVFVNLLVILLACLSVILVALFMVLSKDDAPEALEQKAAAPPPEVDFDREVLHRDWTIYWSDVLVGATQGRKSRRTVLYEDTTRGTSLTDVSVLSVVGPWISTENTIGDSRKWRTVDVSSGRRGGVQLQEIFGDRAVYEALMGDRVIARALGDAEPYSLSELLSSLDGGCRMEMGPSMLTQWAFHHVKPGKVAVRVGLPYGTEACRGKFTQLGMYLPIPSHLDWEFSAAARRGTLMRDLGGK